jgi:hypothetical protein
MICTTCPGSGTLLVMHRGVREFWDCPTCCGAGVREIFGPPTIRIHKIPKASRKSKLPSAPNRQPRENVRV